jgi:hypothetical protein
VARKPDKKLSYRVDSSLDVTETKRSLSRNVLDVWIDHDSDQRAELLSFCANNAYPGSRCEVLHAASVIDDCHDIVRGGTDR